MCAAVRWYYWLLITFSYMCGGSNTLLTGDYFLVSVFLENYAYESVGAILSVTSHQFNGGSDIVFVVISYHFSNMFEGRRGKHGQRHPGSSTYSPVIRGSISPRIPPQIQKPRVRPVNIVRKRVEGQICQTLQSHSFLSFVGRIG